MAEPSVYTTPNYSWHPDLYNKGASFMYSDVNTKQLFQLLAAQPGERIVDMGCGTGELTLRLQELVGEEGLVIGIDASQSMVEAAGAHGVKHLFCCDIQNLIIPEKFQRFAGTFDAVFTNGTLHWCKQDPRGPIRSAKFLLKPGGRCVISEVLKKRGMTLPDPWYLPRSEEYLKLLESEGFHVDHISLNPRVSRLPGLMVDFLRAVYRVAFLKDLNDQEAEEIIQEVSDICELEHKDELGNWSIMYVTVMFQAIAPCNV